MKWAAVPGLSAYVPLSTVTAEGDLIYATGASAVTRLAKGTSGQFLKQGASVPAWASIAWTDLTSTTALTSYVPTWTGTGSNPSLGNGTAAGAYCRLGKMVFGWFLITAGSTTTFGTGTYEFGLPSSRHASAPGNNTSFGAARVVDGGSTGYTGFLGPASAAGAVRIILPSATTSGAEVPVTQTTPMSAASTDTWGGTFQYIAA